MIEMRDRLAHGEADLMAVKAKRFASLDCRFTIPIYSDGRTDRKSQGGDGSKALQGLSHYPLYRWPGDSRG